MPGQGLGDRLVAGGAVRAVVGGDVHALGADRPGGEHDAAYGISPDDLQTAGTAGALAERGVERAQRLTEVDLPRQPRRTPQPGVEDEQREDVAVGRCFEQRGVVGQPEVATEPHHRSHRRPLCQSDLTWVRMHV